MRRSNRLAALLTALILGGGAASVAEEAPTREYQIKAAFLYSFAKFVTWPAESLPEPTSPIVIGVLGENPFGDELRKVVTGRMVNQHAVLVKDVGTAETGRVHLLFVAGDYAQATAALGALATRPVLTVADAAPAAGPKPIITFSLVDERVRFSLDAAAAKRAGLEVSSQLQKLAVKTPDRS